MKYYNYQVTFSEIPEEVTLCINLSNCPIHCPDCHSKFLWKDEGVELDLTELDRILNENKHVSCICFMGGDADYRGLRALHQYIVRWSYFNHKTFKTALYSGRMDMQELADRSLEWSEPWLQKFSYIKVGPFVKSLGGLDSKETNQRLYHMSICGDRLAYHGSYDVKGFDITSKFWK